MFATDVQLWTFLYRRGKRFHYIDTRNSISTFSFGGVSTKTRLLETLVDTVDVYFSELQDDNELLDLYRDKIIKTYFRHIFLLMYDKLTDDDINHIKELLSISEPVFVWGAGADAEDCLSIIEKMGIHVSYIVDSNNKIKKKRGMDVFSPIYLQRETKGTILISSYTYENDIVQEICKMDIEIQYISFSSIVKSIGYYLIKEYHAKGEKLFWLQILN